MYKIPKFLNLSVAKIPPTPNKTVFNPPIALTPSNIDLARSKKKLITSRLFSFTQRLSQAFDSWFMCPSIDSRYASFSFNAEPSESREALYTDSRSSEF